MMQETMRPDRLRSCARASAPYAALVGFTLLLLRPVHGQHRLYWGDLLFYFEPMYGFAKAKLVSGLLPLWNPDVLCGQPYIGNPQTSIFYPTSLLLPLMRSWDFIWAIDMLHLFLCGAATYFYLRPWTRGRLAALCGAMVFEGSSTVLGRLQFPPMIAAMAYIPLVLALVDRVLCRRSAWDSYALTLSIALMLLAAHPQMAYFGLATAIIYSGMRMWSASARSGLIQSTVRASARLVGCMGVGVCLSAVQLLPTGQLVLASPREQMTVQQANRFVLQPDQLLTLVFPYFDGAPSSADYWSDGNAWEPAVFIGWAPLVFIACALTRRRRRRFAAFWLAVCVVAIWLAIGNAGGLYWLAFHVVPGVAAFHDPARFLILSTFGLASLTAFGIDALWQPPASSAKNTGMRFSAAFVGISVLIPLVLYSADWLPTAQIADLAHRPNVLNALEGMRSLSGSPGRLYEPEHQQFWRQYVTAGYSDYGPRDPQGIHAEIDTLLPNLNMRYNQASASGYEPVPLSGPSDLDGLSRLALRRNEPNLTKLLDLLRARWLILPENEHIVSPALHQIQTADARTHPLRVYRVRGTIPGAWLVHDVRRVDGAMRLAGAVAAPNFDPYRTAIVSGCDVEREQVPLTSVVAPAPPGAGVVQVNGDGTSHEYQVDTGPTAGLLVISDAAYPGWTATVDQTAVHTCRADGALLAVPLPAGKHKLVVSYRPQAFQVGLYLSLAAMVGSIAAVTTHIDRTARARASQHGLTLGRLE